MDLDELDVG